MRWGRKWWRKHQSTGEFVRPELIEVSEVALEREVRYLRSLQWKGYLAGCLGVLLVNPLTRARFFVFHPVNIAAYLAFANIYFFHNAFRRRKQPKRQYPIPAERRETDQELMYRTNLAIDTFIATSPSRVLSFPFSREVHNYLSPIRSLLRLPLKLLVWEPEWLSKINKT